MRGDFLQIKRNAYFSKISPAAFTKTFESSGLYLTFSYLNDRLRENFGFENIPSKRKKEDKKQRQDKKLNSPIIFNKNTIDIKKMPDLFTKTGL